MRAAIIAALVLAAASAGCSNLLGFDDPRLTDAGGGDDDGGDGGPGIDAPANTVVGRVYNRNFKIDGTFTDEPIDQTALTIAALIPDSNETSGYRTVSGTGQADGTFVINGVPDGMTYILKLNRTYFVTDAHVIDQHFELPVRGERVNTNNATTVTFTADQMSPAMVGTEAADDYIEIYSFNNSYYGNLFVGPNATTVQVDYDWREGQSVFYGDDPLLEGTKGDDLHLFHIRYGREAISGGRKAQMFRILDWWDAGTTTTLTDGSPAQVSGVFMPAPMNRTLMVNYQRGAFDSGYPGYGQPTQSLSVIAHPIVNDAVWGATLLNVTYDDWSRSPTTSVIHNSMYADPLPASWSRQLYESYRQLRYILLPGTTVPRPVLGGIDRLRALPAGLLTLTPVIQPPGMVRVEGRDAHAGGVIQFDGVQPVTLSWAPVAGAKVYTVTINRVFANGNQTRTQSAGGMTTAGTTVDIPAEVFAGGEFFQFIVSAVQTPADYNNGNITLNGVPYSFARMPTAMFRFSSLCGNGALDTGEQCDESAETPTCDVDCSIPICGDGLRNAAANEQCDQVRPSLACDSDCTLPVCGDGMLNITLEDCDDGNTTDEGNGCNTMCRFNNFCGDGVVQGVIEQCDTAGDSATCDSDCTIAECGDGVHNPSANEQCDYGFGNGQPGNPGCSPECMIMP